MMQRGLPLGLYVTLIASALVHAVVIGVVVFSANAATDRRAETVLITKLVRLGKERPKEFLPRLDDPPAPAPKVAPGGQAEPEPPTQSASDRLAEMRRLSDALQRAKKSAQTEAEGRPEGTPDGDTSRLTEALLGHKYGSEIKSCVQKHYDLEGLTPEQVAGRSVGFFVRVKPDGSFFDVRVERSSNLSAFDQGAQRAVLRCGRVSPPPPEIVDRMRNDGVEFEFVP